MNIQFKAGYIVDCVADVINKFRDKLDKKKPDEQTRLDQINGLLQYVSSFDVEFPYNHTPDFKNLSPVLATLNNIITRGLPTRAPLMLENLFVDINLVEPNNEEFEFNFPKSKTQIQYETIFQLLHILEPKLEISKSQYGGFPGSFSEWRFLNETLKEHPFVKQILQSQRDFSTFGKGLSGGKKLDFSFEFPYLISDNSKNLTGNQRRGIIFEFDGPQHLLNTIKLYDKYRDEVADENNFETLRQSFNDLVENPEIKNQFKTEIWEIFKYNFDRDIESYQVEYSLIFIPLGIVIK